ncbi:hypothetical protein T484DRAFT_1976749 [Baffinella frigidus]|nr:hypothetical protein T484DRAFT_1976749 [Cryptophyta sp. CCMP2293]
MHYPQPRDAHSTPPARGGRGGTTAGCDRTVLKVQHLPELSRDQDSSGEHADEDSSVEHADLVGTTISTPHRRDPHPPVGYQPPVASSEFPTQIPSRDSRGQRSTTQRAGSHT